MHRLAAAAALALLAAVPTLASAGPAVATPHGTTTTTRTRTSFRPRVRRRVRIGSEARTDGAAVGRLAARSFAAPAAPTERDARADPTVTISSHCAVFCFVPEQLTVAVGDTVSWVNTTGTAHTVTRCTPAACNGASGGTGTDASFGSADVAATSGATFSHVFTEPGTYVYYCRIHGYALMHGTITVTAAPTTTAPTPTTAASSVTTSTRVSAAPSPGHLASTGADTDGVTTLAVILVVGGLAASSVRRRRRQV